MSSKKTVSLSEKYRKEELDKAEQWRLEAENTLRISKGKQPLLKISDLDKEEADGPHGGIDSEDPLLKEAGETLVDFIKFVQEKITSK